MSTKLEVKVIKHHDLTDVMARTIANFKNETWIYSIESQVRYLRDNCNLDDLHLILLLNNEIVSYLCIHNVNIVIDGVISTVLGIGSVCTSPKNRGNGYSRMLLEYSDNLILRGNPSVLLCQDGLIDFYKKFNWILSERNHFFEGRNFNIMTRNISFMNSIRLTRLF